MKKIKITKNYKLQMDPNFGKLEDIRYSASRYKLFLQHFTTQLYYNSHIRFYSTKGMGTLANQAQKKAIGIVSGEKAATKALNKKSNCPQIKNLLTPATIQQSKDSSFDYWIRFNSQWENKVFIPAKSHTKLNQALREGFTLSSYCELFLDKNDKWYVRVFVTKEIDKAVPKSNSLGVDVGIVHAVTRSDHYFGPNLKPIIIKEKKARSERRRQGHKKVLVKTILKQRLDTEVNSAIIRCKHDSLNLIVEDPKTLANLKAGSLQGWARCYFANRATVRAQEEQVWITYVYPKNTSITCNLCHNIDKRSRVNQSTFKCFGCGNTVNADYNAAINIARLGQERINSNYLS